MDRATRPSSKCQSEDEIINANIVSISNVAALRALASATDPQRLLEGYYSVNDGGEGLVYYDPTDTSSIDNGGTIFVDTAGHRWKRYVDGEQNILCWGADPTGTVDATPCFQAWHDSLPVGGALFIPAGTYRLNSPLSLSKHVSIRGAAREAVVLNVTMASGDALTMFGANGSTLSSFTMSSPTMRSNDRTIYLDSCNFVTLSDLTIENYFIAIGQDRCTANTIQNIRGEYAAVGSGGGFLQVGKNGLCEACTYDNINVDIQVGPSLPPSTPGFGINFINADAPMLTNLEIIRHGICLLVNPAIVGGSQQLVNALWAVNCAFDSAEQGIVLSGAGGIIASCRFNGCWTSSHAQNGVFIDNSSSPPIADIIFVGHQAFGNSHNGFFVNSTCGLQLIGGVLRANTDAGFAAAAGVSGFSLIGVTSGLGGGVTGNKIGVLIGTGGSNSYSIIGCDLTGNTLGALVDNAMGSDRHVLANRGVATYASGITSIAPTGTSVAVNHGLAGIPPEGAIQITPRTLIGAAKAWYVDTINATSFTLHVDAAPGGTIYFGWQARLAGSE